MDIDKEKYSSPFKKKYSQDEKNRALRIIVECDGNLSNAAHRLGISVPTLSRWYRAARRERLAGLD